MDIDRVSTWDRSERVGGDSSVGAPARRAGTMDGGATAATSARSAWRRHWLFARAFLRSPSMVGTIAVSSPAIVRRVVDGIDFSRARCIVELGPGVGTITRALLRRMRRDAQLLVIETDRDFVRALREDIDDPRLIVRHGTAADTGMHLCAAGMPDPDVVVSGIPFSTLPQDIAQRIVAEVADLLGEDGVAVIYQYSCRVLPWLQVHFDAVETTREWRNLVPMRVFRAQRPRRSGSRAPVPPPDTR